MSRGDPVTKVDTPVPPGPAPVTLAVTTGASLGLGLLVRLTRYGPEPLVTEHLVSYPSHGFVRRGVVGTLVHPFLSTESDVATAMLVLSLVGSAVLYVLLLQLTRTVEDSRQAWFVVAASTSVYAQLGWDYGRVDVVVLVLLVALWIALDRGSSGVVVAALAVIGGLVHEMALLWAAALLVGAGCTGTATWRNLRAPAVGIGLTGVLLLLAGGFEGSDDAFIAAMPVQLVGDQAAVLVRAVPWTGDVGVGVESVARLVELVTPADLVVLPLVLLVTSIALGTRIGVAAAAVTVLPALILATVGIDHVRWAFLLAFVATLQLASVRALPRPSPRRAMVASCVLAVVGAWGLMTMLPYWRLP